MILGLLGGSTDKAVDPATFISKQIIKGVYDEKRVKAVAYSQENTPKISWTRLESWASYGVPDLLGYHDSCGFFMCELKIAYGSKISLVLIKSYST